MFNTALHIHLHRHSNAAAWWYSVFSSPVIQQFASDALKHEWWNGASERCLPLSEVFTHLLSINDSPDIEYKTLYKQIHSHKTSHAQTHGPEYTIRVIKGTVDFLWLGTISVLINSWVGQDPCSSQMCLILYFPFCSCEMYNLDLLPSGLLNQTSSLLIVVMTALVGYSSFLSMQMVCPRPYHSPS